MNKKKSQQNDDKIINYSYTENLLQDAQLIIERSQKVAFKTVDAILVQRNWFLGQRISIEELKHKERADYGAEIIKKLSKELTDIYGKGFDRSNLYHFLNFYKGFQNIVDLSSRQFNGLLSWTHYRVLLQEKNAEARTWYEKEAFEQTWSVKTLQRNISSQYYFRLLASQNKTPVESEMKDLTKDLQNNKLEYVKNPFIAEFLGFSTDVDLSESKLENAMLLLHVSSIFTPKRKIII